MNFYRNIYLNIFTCFMYICLDSLNQFAYIKVTYLIILVKKSKKDK